MTEKYHKIIFKIKEWIEKILKESNANGFVYGVSGGIDSALICAIASNFFPKTSLALRMDIYNSNNDVRDANLVIEHFNVNSEVINLEDIYELFLKKVEHNSLSSMNLKSRLRMNTLYYYAQLKNYLVCGTSNACELYTGYFTKYGDSGSDFMPLANLTKDDVYQCSKILNVPEQIIQKSPSAGLFENQKDEDDLKVKYSEIDAFLKGEKISKESENRIIELHKKSEHKRKMSKTILPIGEIIVI